MTAQTATYEMDYLNHAQPKDVLRWIRHKKSLIMVGARINGLLDRGSELTIPCHQFAASVIGRLKSQLSADYIEFVYDGDALCFVADYDLIGWKTYGWKTYISLPINPFHGMTMPDGSPRTSCTREELEEWKKEEKF